MSEADATEHGERWIDRAAAGRVFQGAGKTTTTRWTVPYDIPELQETPEFWVMKQCPPLMSVGLRCMELGYTFIWKSGQSPYFITPRGTVVDLIVKGNIPYLHVGDQQCQPRPIVEADLMIPLPEDIMNGIVPPPDYLDEAWTRCQDAGVRGVPLMQAPAVP